MYLRQKRGKGIYTFHIQTLHNHFNNTMSHTWPCNLHDCG